MSRIRLMVLTILIGLLPALGFSGTHGGGRSSSHSHSSRSSSGKVHVRAHTTKSGRHVAAHDRTAPNRTQHDNWSAKGNVNPETGKRGTKRATH